MSVTKISYRDAIAEALRMEMGRDPRVIWVGQAAAIDPVTQGLDEVFGPDRVLDLEAADRTTIGVAVGLALEGSVPVCSLSAAELPSRGLDQLAEAAELFERENAPVPIVVRIPCPAAGPAAADHPDRWLLQFPGLKLISASSAPAAKGLLVSAIRDPGPVCFLEEVGLYGEVDTVPEGGHVVPIGEAGVVRPGHRATLIAHGSAVGTAARAAAELEDGIEVLDLRSLAPLDVDGILASIRKTGKVLIVEQSTTFSATAKALTTLVWEAGFEYLDAPLRRVSLAEAAATATSNDPLGTQVNAIKEACDELLAY
jgi:pyruvate/2-oxoglutarate/acetoin dehydrogenase E1 component